MWRRRLRRRGRGPAALPESGWRIWGSLEGDRQVDVDGDPSALHQTRVGLRRFRSALSLFRRALDDPQVEWLGDEVRELALPLGDARDLDVLMAEPGLVDRLDPSALSQLSEQRRAAYVRVGELLDSTRWADVWVLVERFLDRAPWDLEPDPPAVVTAADALQRRWRWLLRARWKTCSCACSSGASQRARAFTMPAFSAMRKKPSHSVSVPKSSTITSTDSLAMENRASTMAAKIWALSPTSHWDSAAMAAVTKKPSQRVLSKEETPCGWWSESVRWRPLVSIVQMGPLQRGGAALASALSNWRRGGQSAG